MRRMVLFLVALATASVAHAKSFGEHGGYEVAATESTQEKKGFCAMMEEFEGPGDTRLYLFRYLDEPDTVLVSIANYNWSAKKNEEYEKFRYQFNQYYYDRTVFGVEDSIWKGFLAAFPYSDFMPVFAQSSFMHVYRDNQIVDKLSLDGSAAAKTAFERCWSWLKVDDAAKRREWSRWDGIPKDPFSNSASSSDNGASASPRGNIVALFSIDDYPASALRNEEQGDVGYTLVIGTDGRVTNCTVVATSGSLALDTATCGIVTRRARFTPARDNAGNPITGTYSGKVRWALDAGPQSAPVSAPQ